MGTVTETKEFKYRVIDHTKCEVWCPVHESDTCVYENCLAGRSVIDGKVNFRDPCSHYVKLHFMGRVICAWPADAPRDALVLPTSPVL